MKWKSFMNLKHKNVVQHNITNHQKIIYFIFSVQLAANRKLNEISPIHVHVKIVDFVEHDSKFPAFKRETDKCLYFVDISKHLYA